MSGVRVSHHEVTSADVRLFYRQAGAGDSALTLVLGVLGVTDKVLYLHDFGAAVGYHLATRAPSTVRGLIVQNGNAHAEGLGAPTSSRSWPG
jgi:pimeloyl-ACP methyl ester carboxylesterase